MSWRGRPNGPPPLGRSSASSGSTAFFKSRVGCGVDTWSRTSSSAGSSFASSSVRARNGEESIPRMKCVLVFGARPNYMKIAPLFRAMEKDGRLTPVLVSTGQHFDREMSEVFVEELGLPAPEVHLQVGQGTPAQQVARVIERLEPVLVREKPGVVIV